MHQLRSVTLTDQEFLSGQAPGRPVTITGELRLPTASTDRHPAVVLLHGSSGPSAREEGWARLLERKGAATLRLNSFAGRGIASTIEDQAQLGRLAMIVDAYRALELLASHPRIDPRRIAVMGFSRGGQAALYSAMKRFRRMFLPIPRLEFAAHVVFYSPCNTRYRDDERVVDKPIRIFQGDADDFVAVGPTKAYVERLRRAGGDVQLTVYPGARHIFDSPAIATPLRLPRAQLFGRCALEEGPDGQILDSETGQPFTYSNLCADRGATVGYNQAAHEKSVQAVEKILVRVLWGA